MPKRVAWARLLAAGCTATVAQSKRASDCSFAPGHRCPPGEVCVVDYDGEEPDDGIPHCEPAPPRVDTSRFPCHSVSTADGGWVELSDGGCR